MKFTPKTEEEVKLAGLAPAGEYDFEVLKALDAVSGPQSKTPGTPMIKLVLAVYVNDRPRHVDALLHPAMEAQVRHFCVAGGILSKYESGDLCAADCVGIGGKVKIGVKDAQGDYPAKNVVKDYVLPKPKMPAPTPKPAEVDSDASPDDDVPF